MRDLLHLHQTIVRGHAPFGEPLQHDADSRQDLAEFVVQFARDMAQGVLLRPNQTAREFAALPRQVRQASEEPTVGIDHPESARQQDRKHHRQK